jgi:hypothetical protein
MTAIILNRLHGFVAVLLLAACASTTLRSAWYDTSYSGAPLKRIMVVGVGGTLSDRRIFEDIFAQKLTTAGVDAVPGYRFIPEASRANEPAWNEGVAASGADGVLVVRVLRVDQKTRVMTTMVPGPMFGPYYAWWGPGWYAVPEVQQYETAIVESTLYDAKTKRPVWSATTETFNPTTVQKETPGFADLIIGQLAARGLAAARK